MTQRIENKSYQNHDQNRGEINEPEKSYNKSHTSELGRLVNVDKNDTQISIYFFEKSIMN